MGVRSDVTLRTARVLIIGSGFAGLGMAAALHRSGEHDLVILEQAAEVGGTWRDNTYPGAACDVASALYSYSFAPWRRGTAARAGQPELLDYLRSVAEPVRDRIEFGARVVAGHWDEAAAMWQVATADGRRYAARFLVVATGALNLPRIPRIPGAETFAGPVFHTAEWDHSAELDGKRVAVIGTGASAVQVVPEIAARARELHLYQRTPAWVLPARSQRPPRLPRVSRRIEYWRGEALVPALTGPAAAAAPLRRRALRHLHRQVDDPALRRALTPDHRIGCKRILYSDSYFPALTRPGSEVVTVPIERIVPGGVVTADGVTRGVDVIVHATGFRVAGALGAMPLAGRGGVTLQELWQRGGIRTHLGVTVAGLPNAFLLSGPNTGLGHNSVLYMIESQIRYVLDAIGVVERSGADVLEVRQDVQDASYRQTQRRLRRAVWSTGGCASWYLDGAGGNHALWPGFSWRYRLRTRRVRLHEYEFVRGDIPWG
ncbi:flavin-containing monooxygenase [Rhodococcus sp. NPDC003318]|uniref:flavin-containing monooxygenase n=1 Tax=Rhodococcus sp. NPDC003318 TaxID=3364503 RepID=UPI0036B7C96C